MTMHNIPVAPRIRAARLPFFGLGLDFGPVLERAAGMRLRPAAAARVESPAAPDAPRTAGYELQIRLGRETRAG